MWGRTVGGKFFANCPKLRERTRRREGRRKGGTHEAHALPGCARAHPRTHALEYLQGRCARWPGCRAGAHRPCRLAARRSLCAAHPADSNSSACAVEMSTVKKSQDPAWKDVLDTKGLSAAATILEEYGLSCESDMLRRSSPPVLSPCVSTRVFTLSIETGIGQPQI